MTPSTGPPTRRWSIEFYTSAEEGSPVEDFLEGLPFAAHVKLFNLIRLLEEQGVGLPFPYSSQVAGRLRELRSQLGKTHFRILYAATPGRGFVLLHGFVKSTRRIPAGEIAVAQRRLDAYLGRQQLRGR